VRLNAADYALPALGQVIELSPVGVALQRALVACPAITYLCPATVVDVKPDHQAVTVTMRDGRRYQAQLLVAADGAQSSVRQQLNLPITQHDYQQTALVATVKLASDLAGCAFERFTTTGPFALLPLSAGRASLVWLMALDDEAFLAQLQTVFGWRLGRFEHLGPRHHYPLLLTRVDYPLAQRTVLVGNAAHALHPIAGQGFNLGMRDLDLLTNTIAEALSLDRDIGEFAQLNRYWQQRSDDQAQTIWLTSSLVQLFSNGHAPLVVGRNIGLALMALCPAFKGVLARSTLGLSTATQAAYPPSIST
jgi:2-octaprenyl-6-methoxyphenol hydroxylase